jgi:hypothetical protein
MLSLSIVHQPRFVTETDRVSPNEMSSNVMCNAKRDVWLSQVMSDAMVTGRVILRVMHHSHYLHMSSGDLESGESGMNMSVFIGLGVFYV